LAGAQVSIESCDVTDRSALAALLSRLAADGTPIHTAIHAAAAIDLRPLTETSVNQLGEIVATKALGAQHLDALLPDDAELVLFSSITGVCGSGEHGAYAAANAYLDAFAEQRRAAGKRTTSIAWGVWDAYNTHDDPARTERRRHLNQRAGTRGLPLMDPDLGTTALGCVLDEGDAISVVADVEWGRFLALFGSVRESRLFVEVAGDCVTDSSPDPRSAGGLRERLAGLSGPERERVLVELVRGHAAAALGHGSTTSVVDASRAFKDLGFDSLIAVELRNRLSAMTGLSLPPTLVFDHPTPAAVAGYLMTELLPDYAPGSVVTELDRLEAALAGHNPGSDERAMIAKRLRTLLWTCTGESPDQPIPEADDDLAAATADDIFDLIDRQLGPS
jgi:acyl carrier protein